MDRGPSSRIQARTGMRHASLAGAGRRAAPPTPPVSPRIGSAGLDRRATQPRLTRALPDAAPRRSGRKSRHATTRHILITLIALQAILLSALAWALLSPALTVRNVTITGTNDAALIQSIRRLRLGGCNVFRCDAHAIEARVEGLPSVATATATAIFPDTLSLAITLRQPAFLWRTAQGAAIVAADGMVLGISPATPGSAGARLPVVEDDLALAFGGKAPQPGMRVSSATAEMATQLRANLASVTGGWAIQLTGDRGFVAESTAGTIVIFGTPADATQVAYGTVSPGSLGATPDDATVQRGVRQQALELRAILAALAQRGARASLVDLRWALHPYYRLGQ